jgi:hypothetical protein
VSIVTRLTDLASSRTRRTPPARRARTRLALEPLEIRAVPAVLSTEHVDIRVIYENQQLGFRIHDETHDADFEPNQALLHVKTEAGVPRPKGSQWDFLGTDAGSTVYVLPQDRSFDPALLYLGTSGEDIDEGTFATYFEADSRIQAEGEFIKISLVNVQGPGQYSLFQTDAAGQPTKLWMSTSAPPADGNAVFIVSSGDRHDNMAFTALGIYAVTFQASAYLGPGATNPVFSDEVTFYFYVGNLGPAGGGATHGTSSSTVESGHIEDVATALLASTAASPGRALAVGAAALPGAAGAGTAATPASGVDPLLALGRQDHAAVTPHTAHPADAVVDHVFRDVLQNPF